MYMYVYDVYNKCFLEQIIFNTDIVLWCCGNYTISFFQGIVYVEFQLWVLVVRFNVSSLSLREELGSPFPVYKTGVFYYTTKTLHFKSLFSMRLTVGISTRIKRKYRMDANWPTMMYGCSTGWPPIHVKVRRSATRVQNRSWLKGRNIMLRCLDV